MNTKLFGFFSVTAFTGAAVLSATACTSTTTTTIIVENDASVVPPLGSGGEKKTTPDAGSNSKSPSSDEGTEETASSSDGGGSSSSSSDDGGKGDPSPDGESPPDSCLDPTPIDATDYPYAAAKRAKGACTEAELDALVDYVTELNGAPDLATWKGKVGPTCAECAFTEVAATSWGPILTANGAFETISVGGCIEIKSGKQACGEAFQRVVWCRIGACSSLCETKQEFDDCVDDLAVFDGPCWAAYNTMITACGANFDDYQTQCRGTTYAFEEPIRAQCIDGN